MKNFSKIALIWLVTSIFIECRTAPPIPPKSNASSVLAVVVNLKPQIGFSIYPEIVYFVKITDKAKSYQDSSILQSTYMSGSTAFLLNAEPGKYAVVAAYYREQNQSGGKINNMSDLEKSTDAMAAQNREKSQSGYIAPNYVLQKSGNIAFFAEDLIKETETNVVPSKISFIGNVTVDMKAGMDTADKAQKFFGDKLAPGTSTASLFFASLRSYTGTKKEILKEGIAKTEFKKNIAEDFKETPWSHLIEK